MLCEPVTYEAAPVQLIPAVRFSYQFCDRYVMLPTTAGVVAVAGTNTCPLFTTRMRSRVGLGSRSLPAHWYELVPRPASRSSLLVIGEVHFTCWTRCGLKSPRPSASGEVVGDGDPLNERHPVTFREIGCSSQTKGNRFRCDDCHVMRGV